MMDNLKDSRWWMSRFVELAAALAIGYMTIQLIEYREAVRRDEIPASDWFELRELYVPDHAQGSDPLMVYDRVIKEDHRGFWVAEVQKVKPDGRSGVFQNVCSGSGVAEYETTDVLGPDNAVSWSWFLGRPCRVQPGNYRILLSRDMVVPGYPVKSQRSVSNIFRITD
jgi:hypothetical protein